MQILFSKTIYSFFKLHSLSLPKFMFRLQSTMQYIFNEEKMDNTEKWRKQDHQSKTSSVNVLIYSLLV